MSEKKSWTIPGAHFGGDPEFFTAWTLFDIGLDSSKSRDNLHILMGLMSEQTLISESNGLPMQTGLNETAKLEPKIITSGADANTFFIRHESL